MKTLKRNTRCPWASFGSLVWVSTAAVVMACGGEPSAQTESAVQGRREDHHLDEPLRTRSRYVEVFGSRMHYLQAGDPSGPPILLLHGQPTSSYLWRNIIPHLPREANIIAPDSIGYGRSDAPDIEYSWLDHIEYMEAFIECLGLRDIILVVHDIGSFQGFAYAQRHPNNVRGIVMMEAVVQPFPPFELIPSVEGPMGDGRRAFVEFLRTVRANRAEAERLIVDENIFIETFLPQLVLRRLRPEEMNAYRRPFRTRESRFKMIAPPLGLPIGGVPAENHTLVSEYAQYLATSAVPKLILYGEPGLLFSPAEAQALAAVLPNAQARTLGPGLHFLQEDHPEAIAAAISDFFDRLAP